MWHTHILERFWFSRFSEIWIQRWQLSSNHCQLEKHCPQLCHDICLICSIFLFQSKYLEANVGPKKRNTKYEIFFITVQKWGKAYPFQFTKPNCFGLKESLKKLRQYNMQQPCQYVRFLKFLLVMFQGLNSSICLLCLQKVSHCLVCFSACWLQGRRCQHLEIWHESFHL